ncbi:MAG: DUF1501 domain-containing protein [Chloroflexota bacterium]
MTQDMHTLNRRAFIRQSACAALGATAMVNTLSYLHLTNAALAQSSPTSDYKALVCLFLAGGNDSNNLLIPGGTPANNPVRAHYVNGRGMLAINDLSQTLTVPSTTGIFGQYYPGVNSPLSVHPNAGQIAELFNSGDLAFVCNVGSLAEPIPNRQAFLNKLVDLPSDLYSHSDQQMQWQTSLADSNAQSGWGGRIADMLHEAYNAEQSKVSMSISLAGINTWQRGTLAETLPYTIGTNGAEALIGYGPKNAPYRDAYHTGASFTEPNYKNNRQGTRLRTLETLLRLTRSNLLEDTYVNVASNARTAEETIGAATSAAQATGINFNQHFQSANSQLGRKLKMVAQLIAGRSALGNSRQIFFVSVDGYDIHREHLSAHAALMNELSNGMMAFRNTLKAMGDWDKVLTFTASDFNRTFTPNGTSAQDGTDHAWGGHAMVMGGPVVGGELYGHFPSLKVGNGAGSLDADKSRGRFIPSVSVDQYSAILARWFGVGPSEMEEIFPNLHRFDDPFTSSTANMQFIPTA